jgi:hypothetical protein
MPQMLWPSLSPIFKPQIPVGPPLWTASRFEGLAFLLHSEGVLLEEKNKERKWLRSKLKVNQSSLFLFSPLC